MATPFDILNGLSNLMTPDAMKAMQSLPARLEHWGNFMDALVKHGHEMETRVLLNGNRLELLTVDFEDATRTMKSIDHKLTTILSMLHVMQGDTDQMLLASFVEEVDSANVKDDGDA
jgi:hypothetical protein